MKRMTAGCHEVLALAPDCDAGTRSELSALGVEAVDISPSRTGMNPVWDVRDIIGLHAKMHRLNPDVVLACAIKPVIYGIPAAAMARVQRRVALVTGLGNVFYEGGSPRARIAQTTDRKRYRIALR